MPDIQTLKITGYHAHVYYYDEQSRALAAALREKVSASFRVVLGRFRDEPIGPHPAPMYQIAFAPDQFPRLVPWLMLNRAGLTILIHPETGDDLLDHRDYAMWLGEKLPLRFDFL